MPVSEDLLNAKFEKSGFGGYKTAEVDSYVYEVSQTIGRMKTEISDLKRKLDNTAKKMKEYEEGEESLKLALIKAQRLADETVKAAQDRADAMLKEAHETADTLVKEAQSKAGALISKAEHDIVYRREESVRIKKETAEFHDRILGYYKAHLELLNSIPCEEPPYVVENNFAPGNTGGNTADDSTSAQAAAASAAAAAVKSPESNKENAAYERAAFKRTAYERTDEIRGEKPDVPFSADTAQAADPQAYSAKAEDAKPDDNVIYSNTPSSSDNTQIAKSNSRSIKLNLKFNEKTGEYEPIGMSEDDDNTDENKNTGKKSRIDRDNIKFGLDYDISTDSFGGKPRGRR